MSEGRTNTEKEIMPNLINPVAKETFDVIFSTGPNVFSSVFLLGEFLSSSEEDFSEERETVNGALVRDRLRFYRDNAGNLKGEVWYRPDAPFEEIDPTEDFTYNTDIELIFDEESGELDFDQSEDFGGTEVSAAIYILADDEEVFGFGDRYLDGILRLGIVDIEGKPYNVIITFTMD